LDPLLATSLPVFPEGDGSKESLLTIAPSRERECPAGIRMVFPVEDFKLFTNILLIVFYTTLQLDPAGIVIVIPLFIVSGPALIALVAAGIVMFSLTIFLFVLKIP